MKKLLLSLATKEIRAIAEPFLQNHKAYAERNGYVYQCAEESIWKDLHPSFSKVALIDKALNDGADIVLWTDCDVAYMNFKFDLADLLVGDYFMAAYQQQNWPAWAYLCAGLTVWRGNEYSAQFVAEWKERCEIGSPAVRPGQRVIITHAPFEQWYLDELVRKTNYKGIRPCDADEIGCFSREIWHDGIKWKPGMPTVHFAGPATFERKVSVFKTTYASQVIR